MTGRDSSSPPDRRKNPARKKADRRKSPAPEISPPEAKPTPGGKGKSRR
jgi:hypothetical protein